MILVKREYNDLSQSTQLKVKDNFWSGIIGKKDKIIFER